MMSVVAYHIFQMLSKKYEKYEKSNLDPKLFSQQGYPQFNLIINTINTSIQVSGYLGLDTWILILSNYPMFGYMDSWISQFFMYPDTWIHGYLDIMDNWIFGYLDISTFLVPG